jgi:hypothetical protein
MFQYQVFNNLDIGLFTPDSTLSDGWHRLDSNSTSGAMDYARSPILQRPLGCLALFWGILNSIFNANVQTWTNVTGNEAGEALIAMVTGSKKLFAFGAPYTSGYGVHDVHCNQGDPPANFRIWMASGKTAASLRSKATEPSPPIWASSRRSHLTRTTTASQFEGVGIADGMHQHTERCVPPLKGHFNAKELPHR